jgi:uncharacterized repeat protein (TIGR01451 family)
MLSRFSLFLVSGAVLFSTGVAARGQDERPSAPWPFGKLQNPIHWPGKTADAASNAGTNDSQAVSQDSGSNPSNQKSTVSESAQNDTNRRFYGPSLALRPGVAYGYAPQNGYAPPASNAPQSNAPQKSTWPRIINIPRLSASDTNPVISQGSASATGAPASPPSDADVRLSPNSPAIMRNRTADDFSSSSTTGSLAQDFHSAGTAPRDTRSLQERLAAMRQTSDRGATSPTPAATAKPAPTMVDVLTSAPTAPAMSGEVGTRGVPYSAGLATAPYRGPSSRRVVDSSADADDAATNQPEAIAKSGAETSRRDVASQHSSRATAPNLTTPNLASPDAAAAVGSASKTDSMSPATAPSPVKPRSMEFTANADVGTKPAAVKADPFGAETIKLDSTKSDAVKSDLIKRDAAKLGSEADSHKIDLSASESNKLDNSGAASGPAISHAPTHDMADSDGPSASSGQAKAAAKGGVLFTRQSPLVSVETTGPRSIVIGREATYQIAIKNAGDVGAQDLTVSVKIPEWTDIAGSQATAGTTRAAPDATEPFQWKIPRLDAHSKETLSLRLLPRKGRGFDLAVQWTFTPIASQTVVDVQEPKLNMTIAGPDEVVYGQSKVYRLTIANPGTGDAENVVVQLEPIGNSTASPTRHPIGTIRAGDSKVVELELTARQTGSVSIRASATAEPGLTAEAAQDVLVRRAAVALTVDGAKSRFAGTLAAYSIKVTNPGNATAENVHITATLPAGAKFISASYAGQWKPVQGKVVWSLPPLRSGGDAALELKCTLANPGPNRLQIASSAAGDVSDAAAITTNVEALADLKLDVAEPAGPIGVGDEVNYELRIHNRGSKAAEAVAVVVYFSEGIEPESAMGAPSDISNGVVAFRPLSMVPAGGEISLKIKARAQHAGKQVFRAEVECGTLGTKLVNSQEMAVYSGDGGPVLEGADHAIAGRNSPLQLTPGRSDDNPFKPIRR